MQEIDISWHELDRTCFLLASRIGTICSRGAQPTSAGLICVSRGGMVITRLVDGYLRRLGHKLPIGYIQATSYSDREQSKVELSDLFWPTLETNADTPALLFIIDDLVDTGHTMKAIKESLKDTHNAGIIPSVLFYKNHSEVVPAIYIHMAEDDAWITFPYEVEDFTEMRE